MSLKIDSLERTVLELGTEIYRVKHRMESVEKENHQLQEILVSLRTLLDDKGVISSDDFDDAVALDRIIAKQAGSPTDTFSTSLDSELKKAIN